MNTFYVGQKIKIIGDPIDFTDELYGHIAIIKEIGKYDLLVDIIDRSSEPVQLNTDWFIYKHNAIPVED